MKPRLPIVGVFVACVASLAAGPAMAADPSPFVFRDVAGETGLRGALAKMHGHAAAWGDANGDGRLDLYVGAFQKPGTRGNLLLTQSVDGSFVPNGQRVLQLSARSSGAVFVDLDNDGDLDLYVSNLGGGQGEGATPNALFRNDGRNNYVDVSAASGACPAEFRGRSVAALDFDGDGLLDLAVAESLAYGSAKRSRLFRNLGGMKFDDVSERVGLPALLPGLGVAAGDVNQDGWPDLFFAAAEGGNRLFVNERGQRFVEPESVRGVFQAAWKYGSGDDTTAGVCLGDVNRDGRLDVVIGHHFERPWLAPIGVRLYLNESTAEAVKFVDATDAAGLIPLPMKAPHVELQDFDNDGWPDLYVSQAKFADGAPAPLIFHHGGLKPAEGGGRVPRFREHCLGVNGFPTDEDRAIKRTGEFFTKMIAGGQMTYTAAAPTGDYDGDGRIDIFFTSWWIEANAMLLRNESPERNWLQVAFDLAGAKGINRQGIGARLLLYKSGVPHSPETLVGCQELAVGYGYSSGQPAVAHFGLGDAEKVDLAIEFPHGRGRKVIRNCLSNQRLIVTQPADERPPGARGQPRAGRLTPVAAPAVAEFPPPRLPGGKTVVTDESPAMLKPLVPLREGVKIAATPPKVDFAWVPGQDYAGKPWSNWGDSLAVGDKYYFSVGDHLAPAGNAFVYEYDPARQAFRLLVDLKKVLKLPEGHYAPGKIHSRLDLGKDGRIYFSTHRGSTRVTTDQYHYTGDWIVAVDPQTAESEIIVRGPVPKHCLPTSVLDPDRLIYYGGTAPGEGKEGAGVMFYAFDCAARKLLYSGPDGPPRYLIFARSTGKVYYTAGVENGPLMRFDPAQAAAGPVRIPGEIGIRAATQETAGHVVYTVSQGRQGAEPTIYAFDTQTEKITPLGSALIAEQGYITSLDCDASGRFLYYIPGAHGSGDREGTPVIQFDTQKRTKRVLAFLHPFYADKYGAALVGTYSSALSPEGDKLYVCWNVRRAGVKAWESVAMTVIHIPAAERDPAR